MSFRQNFPFFSLCQLPVTIHYWEESGSLSFTHSNQIALSLPFPRLDSFCHHSSFLHERCSSHLTTLLVLHKPPSAMSTSLLYWRVQNGTQHFRCGFISAEEGENPFLVPAGSTSPSALSAVSLHSYDGASLVHVQLFVHQNHETIILCRAAYQSVGPKNVQVHGAVSPQVLEFVFPLHQLLYVSLWPIIQPVDVPLSASKTTWCVSQFWNICKLVKSALCFTIQVFNKELSSTRMSVNCCWLPLLTCIYLDLALLITSLWAHYFTCFSVHTSVHLFSPYSINVSMRMVVLKLTLMVNLNWPPQPTD